MERGNILKSSMQDQAGREFHKINGTLKEPDGKLRHMPKLKADGTVGNAAGSIPERIAQFSKAFGK